MKTKELFTRELEINGVTVIYKAVATCGHLMDVTFHVVGKPETSKTITLSRGLADSCIQTCVIASL